MCCPGTGKRSNILSRRGEKRMGNIHKHKPDPQSNAIVLRSHMLGSWDLHEHHHQEATFYRQGCPAKAALSQPDAPNNPWSVSWDFRHQPLDSRIRVHRLGSRVVSGRFYPPNCSKPHPRRLLRLPSPKAGHTIGGSGPLWHIRSLPSPPTQTHNPGQQFLHHKNTTPNNT